MLVAFDVRQTDGRSLSLIRTLTRAIFTGSVAGLTCGLLLANVLPPLQALLSAAGSGARLAFLIVCLQVGAAVALPIAMLPTYDE